MEFIIENTNIFEEKCITEFEKLIRQNFCDYKKEVPYSIEVCFHVNRLCEEEKWRAVNKTMQAQETKRIKQEDTVQEAMSYQLDKLKGILEDQGFEITDSKIIGDYLYREDIIKIQFDEDRGKPFYSGRGKNKKRIKGSLIVPNLSGTNFRIAKYMSNRLSKIFYGFMEIVRDEYLLSEILDIEHTRDLDILFSTFSSKYRNLAWPFENDKDILFEELINKALDVFESKELLDRETLMKIRREINEVPQETLSLNEGKYSGSFI